MEVKTIKKSMSYDVCSFIASDGKEFSSERDCKDYERELTISHIKQASSDSTMVDGIWYLAENEEDMNLLKEFYRYHGRIIAGNFQIGWNLVTSEYAGDNASYIWDYIVWPEAEIREDIDLLFKCIKNKEE